MPACTGMMVVFSSSLNFKVFLGAAVGRAKGATHPTAHYRFALMPAVQTNNTVSQKRPFKGAAVNGEMGGFAPVRFRVAWS